MLANEIRRIMEIKFAPDVARILKNIVGHSSFVHVDAKRIICVRSFGAKSRARARIWSFPKIWQLALSLPSYYVIEVLSHRFDNLGQDDKVRVLIHELMHIPKNFSGALVPHRGIHRLIDSKSVERIFNDYTSSRR